MGWAYGTAADGREIGYAVKATCDMPGCDVKIARGIDYLCGGHAALDVVVGGADGPGCGKYYCGAHDSGLDGRGTCDHPARVG